MSGICPQCGGEDVEDIEGGSNGYCPECCEVVEIVDEFDLDSWTCFNCESANLGVEEVCNICGLSRDASDYLTGAA